MSAPSVTPVKVLLTVVVGVSFIGFLRGTTQDDYTFEPPLRDLPEAHHGDVHKARPYWELRDSPRGAGPVLEADLAAMGAAVPGRADAVSLAGHDKRVALMSREATRAYFGAPPVIPHPARQQTQAECTACHDNGVRLGNKAAAAYPHDAFVSCTQCHAMAEPSVPWEASAVQPDPRAVQNLFVGEHAPLQGERWTDVAPPRLPHPTFMHERCTSCHGPNGRDALKSTHPERQSCLQCHVTNAAIEQRP